jgi:UPF0755 protein
MGRVKPRNSGRRVVLIVALAVAGLTGYVTRVFARPSGAAVRVIIPEASTFRAAADSLERAGIVDWPRVFSVYARISGTDRELKPGTYLFRPNTPWRDVLTALTGGKGLVRSVTIPEGFSVAQITPVLATALEVPAESVSAAMRDTALINRLDVPTRTLEGYLFPDTYAFPEGTTARRAIIEMTRRFEREWAGEPEWDQRLLALGRTRHEIVTMASIVEEEAKLAHERPVIAAVYYNRLRIGMPLQADPTVQYARGRHRERVTYRDLTIDSPYNTYRYPGLPPGPISSPGGASLRAALFPANVRYRYFVAFPDGHHEFRTTLQEHNAARAARPDSDSIARAQRRNGATRTATPPPAASANRRLPTAR